MPASSPAQTEVQNALERICAGLEGVAPADWTYEIVGETVLPAPFRALLVHRDHMTATLREHYAAEIALHVLQDRNADGWYRRLITLSLAGSDRIIELGVVAIDLTRMPSAVQEAILEGRRPLGDILMGSAVMREIVPQWYLRFGDFENMGLRGGKAPLPDGCGAEKSPLPHGRGTDKRRTNLVPWGVSFDHDVFGRVGVIHCDGHPAIELLEIVTGEEVAHPGAPGWGSRFEC